MITLVLAPHGGFPDHNTRGRKPAAPAEFRGFIPDGGKTGDFFPKASKKGFLALPREWTPIAPTGCERKTPRGSVLFPNGPGVENPGFLPGGTKTGK